MVAHPRTALGAYHLRAVNLPQAITVHADAAGVPVTVQWGGQRVGVSAVQDCWRIDEEWWQQEITRRYFLLHLEDGRLLTVFHDLVDGGWFRQAYA